MAKELELQFKTWNLYLVGSGVNNNYAYIYEVVSGGARLNAKYFICLISFNCHELSKVGIIKVISKIWKLRCREIK